MYAKAQYNQLVRGPTAAGARPICAEIGYYKCMFSWRRIFRLLVVVVLFCVGFILWFFLGFVTLEVGSSYSGLIGIVSGASLLILWLALSHKILNNHDNQHGTK
jgi:hypothetical protein